MLRAVVVVTSLGRHEAGAGADAVAVYVVEAVGRTDVDRIANLVTVGVIASDARADLGRKDKAEYEKRHGRSGAIVATEAN